MDMPKDRQLIRIKNLLSMLGRGKWELQGEEILAFAQSIEFVLDLEKDLKAPIVPQPIEVKEPIKEAPKNANRRRK